MKFEIGKKYRTRGGSIAEITGIVPGDTYSVWALVDGCSRGYTRDGQWDIECENDLDLVEEIVDAPPTDRRWTIVISSYTGHVSDQIGIEGEVLTVVPESDLLDAQSQILELEKEIARYQNTVGDQERRLSEYGQVFSEIDFQAVGNELGLPIGTLVYKNILPGIRELKDEILRKRVKITQLEIQVAALGGEQYEINCRNIYLKAALEKAQSALLERDDAIDDLRRQIESQNTYIESRQESIADLESCILNLRSTITDLQDRIDAAAGRLDGALDALAGPADKTKYAGRAYIEAARPTPPVIEVGGAYKTRGGSIGIVVKSDEDEVYPFDVEGADAVWSVTPNGTEFISDVGDYDLFKRIPFPESSLPNPPEGFVYAGYGPLPTEKWNPDVAGWSNSAQEWWDSGRWTGDSLCTPYAVRIGSPVHFALASKFSNEA